VAVISWTESPSATISSPANGAVYARRQAVSSSFACSDLGGPGISSCTDGNGKASGAAVDTNTAGQHTFTVTATSSDGVAGSANTTYTVVSSPPRNTLRPVIAGTPTAGQRLSCSTGSWTSSPTSFTYQWNRGGTPLVGATRSTYVIQKLDEGSTLTCSVTGSNPDGSAAATSVGVRVRVPHVPSCPAATGMLSGNRLGPVRLGITRKQALHEFSHSSNRRKRYQDFFCLTPIGVRVGYASPTLLRTLSLGLRQRVGGRVVWASTANPFYVIKGVRPGATLAAASRRLHLGKVLRIGLNDWYLGPAGSVTAVLKVRHGVVQEIGIANLALTMGRGAQQIFMTSFE
jgi:hypothetical protein